MSRTLESVLDELSKAGAKRIAKSVTSAGIAAIKRAIKSGAKGTIKKNVGSTVKSSNNSTVIKSKVGINVGGAKIIQSNPHAHLYVIGSRKRTRKRLGGQFAMIKNPTQQQLNTGEMPGSDFINRAVSAAQPAAISAMNSAAQKALMRESARAAK